MQRIGYTIRRSGCNQIQTQSRPTQATELSGLTLPVAPDLISGFLRRRTLLENQRFAPLAPDIVVSISWRQRSVSRTAATHETAARAEIGADDVATRL